MRHVVDMTAVKRIAIVRLSAMGDCILLQPTVLRILEYFPDIEIDWYIDKSWVSLFPKISRLYLIPIQKPKSIKDYFQLRRDYFYVRYDVLLAMQASFRANVLYSFVRAPIKVGFDRLRAKDGQWLWSNVKIEAGQDHLAEGFTRFADVLGVPKLPIKWHLARPSKSDLPLMILDVIQQQRPIFGCLLAASKLERTPYVEFWIDMLTCLNKLVGVKEAAFRPLVLLLGGPTALEEQLAKEVQEKVEGLNLVNIDLMNFVGQTSLLVLAGILDNIHCLVSPDSGPVHLANALGTPVIGLYAVAPSCLSGPYSYQELTFDFYDEAVKQFLDHDPKQNSWGVRVHNRNAMNLIPPQQVADRVCNVLEHQCSKKEN